MPTAQAARRVLVAVVVTAALGALAGCTGSLALSTAGTRAPSSAVSLLTDTGSPSELTARFARTLFATSPVVVVASAAGSTGASASTARKTLAAATRAASAAHAPLLLGPRRLTPENTVELPDVGLAIDPEWKLRPKQKPLRQIGHVDIGEVNDVISWLAALTARHHLPQKLLVLHQFQLAMIVGEQHLDTGHDDLAIVIHMDGQGKPGAKKATWNAVTSAAPPGVYFGWKDFLVMDHPTFTPRQTMAQSPLPVMISYQ